MTTRRSIPRPARRALALAALTTLALAGCGGGQTDDEGDGTTGLVPTAPTLGATLYSDAKVLRPLVAGARWEYAGIAPDGDAYANVVTHASATPGVNESGTNILDSGATRTHVVVINGNIVQPDPADANGDGVPDYADAVELRSPVRVNDQIVVVDKRQPDAVPDIDGDGRREFFDVAVYSRVVGNEDVALNGLPTLQAVRVDRTQHARIVLSKDGKALPTYTTLYSVWYAPSVGIVRRRFEKPAEDGNGKDIADERVTGWSGLP
jgi:hypothetical protein